MGSIKPSTKQISSAKQMMEFAPFLMHRVRPHVLKAAEGSLTLTQYRVLSNIHRGLNTIGEIANHHGVAQPSMSKIILNLEKRKLLQRSGDLKDRRSSLLKLTVAGEKLFSEVRSQAQLTLAQQIAKLDDSQIKCIDLAIEQLTGALKEWNP